MKPTTCKRTPIVAALFAVTTAWLLAPLYSCAQQPPATCADWTAVQSWTGIVTVSGAGQATDQFGNTYTTSQQATINFTASINGNSCGPNTLDSWIAQGPQVAYSVNVHDTKDGTCIDDKNPFVLDPLVSHFDVSSGSSSAGNVYLSMDFGGQTPTYSVTFGEVVDGLVQSSPGNSACGIPAGSATAQGSWGPGGLLVAVPPTTTPLPVSVSPLIGSVTFGSYDGTFGAGSNATWTINWNFTPVLDADVVVKIPNYDTWRPTAGRSETEVVGDLLTVQAQLVQKSTGQPAVGVIPDRWSFSLMKEVSHEPGVAMNWPSVKDRVDPLHSPPDMTFDKLINLAINPSLTISNNDTLAEVLNPSQTPSPQNAEVILVPFDWGGWATLNVTATVFGVPIKGHLQLPNGQNVTDILLPLRQPGSHIADIWKTQNNVPLSTPDSDDSEVDPQGRSDCVGDGFTLYEEYRGFMENGKHIEGDPHSKDFFILNEIGADAEPGIFLFTALTGLTVHKDIQKNEVETTPRPILKVDGVPVEGNPLINFNVGQGAFEVQQHGVLLITCDAFDGGQTLWPSAGPTNGNQIFAADHAQPGITDLICMQERDAPGTINPGNTHGGSITPVNALLQYDVAVAHELLHSVGVLHHGDRDDEGSRFFTLLFPYDPRNTTGQPVFQLAGQNVLVLDEQSGQDQAINLWNGILALAQQCDALKANPGAFPHSLADACARFKIALTNPLTGQLDTTWDETLWVGEPQGKHSGNDQCVMRYFVANAYPSVAPLVGAPVFYTVPAGTEPVGFSVCTSPAGTGVNDPKHPLPKDHPQPRYFDARSGRGACKTWICVNDFYTPAADSQ